MRNLAVPYYLDTFGNEACPCISYFIHGLALSCHEMTAGYHIMCNKRQIYVIALCCKVLETIMRNARGNFACSQPHLKTAIEGEFFSKPFSTGNLFPKKYPDHLDALPALFMGPSIIFAHHQPA